MFRFSKGESGHWFLTAIHNVDKVIFIQSYQNPVLKKIIIDGGWYKRDKEGFLKDKN